MEAYLKVVLGFYCKRQSLMAHLLALSERLGNAKCANHENEDQTQCRVVVFLLLTGVSNSFWRWPQGLDGTYTFAKSRDAEMMRYQREHAPSSCVSFGILESMSCWVLTVR